MERLPRSTDADYRTRSTTPRHKIDTPMTKYDSLNIDLRRVYRTAMKNSIRRNIRFALSKEEFAGICERAKSHCELSGIVFDYTKPDGKWERRPWAASLDRIDHTSVYNATNCRLICVSVNLAMNTWGEETLKEMARGLLATR